MCSNPASELRMLNAQVSGSLREAEMQRLVHRTLFDNQQAAYDAYAAKPSGSDHAEYVEWCRASRAWTDHLTEHRRQADEIRQQRIERVK